MCANLCTLYDGKLWLVCGGTYSKASIAKINFILSFKLSWQELVIFFFNLSSWDDPLNQILQNHISNQNHAFKVGILKKKLVAHPAQQGFFFVLKISNKEREPYLQYLVLDVCAYAFFICLYFQSKCTIEVASHLHIGLPGNINIQTSLTINKDKQRCMQER